MEYHIAPSPHMGCRNETTMSQYLLYTFYLLSDLIVRMMHRPAIIIRQRNHDTPIADRTDDHFVLAVISRLPTIYAHPRITSLVFNNHPMMWRSLSLVLDISRTFGHLNAD